MIRKRLLKTSHHFGIQTDDLQIKPQITFLYETQRYS